jgi:hypothetical protein
VNFDHHEVHYDVCKPKNKKHKAQLDDVNELKMYFYFLLLYSVLLKSSVGLVVLLL